MAAFDGQIDHGFEASAHAPAIGRSGARSASPLATSGSGMEGMSGILTIDLSALARNYRRLCAMTAHGRVAAVIKANAYGLGSAAVSQTLHGEGCRDFFVAQFVEALDLRSGLSGDADIFVLNGLQPGSEMACARTGIMPVLNSVEQFDRYADAARRLGRRLPAVLQFDTGMARLGIAPGDRPQIADRLGGSLAEPCPLDILFVMSHLACADDADNSQNDDQRREMERIAMEFSALDLCFANSGGIFLGKAYHGNMTRSGIALYGGIASLGNAEPMEAVVSLRVPVIQVRTVPLGTKIGYGGHHVAKTPMRLATISAGYADGLPRSLSDRGAVYLGATRLPIIGRVSMDSIIVDASDAAADGLTLGSLVEVLGPHQTVDDLAIDADTISYEILVRLGQRYQRRYV